MEHVKERIRARGRGLLGTWVKIPAIETVQLIGRAGFDFVVIDMEHAPLSLGSAIELIFCAQAMNLLAFVRLPDDTGATVQPLLDGGADGLLVPRVASPERAAAITRRMVFAPRGERGLGATSRAGGWGLAPLSDYLQHGDSGLRMIQLEDWASLQRIEEFLALDTVNGVFIGHGDLFLSSGKPPSDPGVQELTSNVLASIKAAGLLSGVAVATPQEARVHLDSGFSLVMLSNDATIFGQAAAAAVQAVGDRLR